MVSDDNFNRLENKIDKLDNRLDSIDVTLAAQHVSLKEHMRRTQILEDDLEPIKTHVIMVQGGLKLIGLFALCISFAAAVVEILTYFRR